MFKSINSSKEQKLQENLNFFRGINNLHLFGVPIKYCLDKTQIEHISNSNSSVDFSVKGTAHFNFLQKDSNTIDKDSEFFSAKGSVEKKLFLSVYSFGGRNLMNEDVVNDNESPNKEPSMIYRDFTENSDDQQFFEVNGGESSKENNAIHIDNDLKISNSPSIFSKESKEETKFCQNDNNNHHHDKKKFIMDSKILDKLYGPAISSLESIVHIKSSLNKIKILKKTVQKIYFCIHSFYKENHLNLPTDLDNMEIVSIFIYLIVNAKIEDLLSECDVIENFTLCNIFESIGGYYYVIFKLILQFFLDVDIKTFDEQGKEAALHELCKSIIQRLRTPDSMTIEIILNIKKNVHKNYKTN